VGNVDYFSQNLSAIIKVFMFNRDNLQVFSILMGLSSFTAGCGLVSSYDRNEASEGYTEVRVSGSSEQASFQFENLMNRFSLIRTAWAGALNGGLMVYLQGIDGTPFSGNFYLYDESDSRTFTVPNGKYQVYSIGYTTPKFGLLVAGGPKCGFGNSGLPVHLAGGDHTISIQMNSTNCGSPVFSMPDFVSGGRFVPIQVVGCTQDGLNQVSSPYSTCTGPDQGIFNSVEFEMVHYVIKEGKAEFPDNGRTPIRACVDLVNGVSQYGIPAPVGGSSARLQIPTLIHVYNGTGCSANGLPVGHYGFFPDIISNRPSVMNPSFNQTVNTVLASPSPSPLPSPSLSPLPSPSPSPLPSPTPLPSPDPNLPPSKFFRDPSGTQGILFLRDFR
jgi:hypothetical protein